MKVLILGTPRSGTTRLARYFQSGLNYTIHLEPWNEYIRTSETRYSFPFALESNCAVKSIIHQLPDEYSDISFTEFYKELLKEYELVIFLSRKDREAVLKSYTFQRELMIEDEKLGRPNSWHRPYNLKDNYSLPIEKYRQEVDSYFEIFDKVKQDLNLEVTWYEDLYSGNKNKVSNIIKKWGKEHSFDNIIKYVHPSKRYKRQTSLI